MSLRILQQLFVPSWTVEDVLNVIIDAVENDRFAINELIDDETKKRIHIVTKCGMIIEIIKNLNTKKILIYPEQKWVRMNIGKCDGFCKSKVL